MPGITWAYCESVKAGLSWPRRSYPSFTGTPAPKCQGGVGVTQTAEADPSKAAAADELVENLRETAGVHREPGQGRDHRRVGRQHHAGQLDAQPKFTQPLDGAGVEVDDPRLV